MEIRNFWEKGLGDAAPNGGRTLLRRPSTEYKWREGAISKMVSVKWKHFLRLFVVLWLLNEICLLRFSSYIKLRFFVYSKGAAGGGGGRGVAKFPFESIAFRARFFCFFSFQRLLWRGILILKRIRVIRKGTGGGGRIILKFGLRLWESKFCDYE